MTTRKKRIAANISHAIEVAANPSHAEHPMMQTLGRVNPLVKRGSRLSAFRPSPGTPKFMDQVEQARMEVMFNRQRREQAGAAS